jgi:Cdc6-like AAA superfamily ATPase
MQIQQISVEGLFGTFNHVIPLNTKDRITIIHGPNGFGKTAILKMLSALFNGNSEVFLEIVFDRFQVELTDGTIISASTEFINIPNYFERKNVVFKRHNKNSTKSFHSWKETGESPPCKRRHLFKSPMKQPSFQPPSFTVQCAPGKTKIIRLRSSRSSSKFAEKLANPCGA